MNPFDEGKKVMTIKLSQTVAGNWVITLPNPEERGWETQLAEFDMEVASAEPARSAMMKAAAAAAIAIAIPLGKKVNVTSHIGAEKMEMDLYLQETEIRYLHGANV
jgi:hypothetical protein